MFWEEHSLSFIASLAATDTRTYVTFFNIALDGSGTPGQDAAIAYAGAGASVAQWAAFTEQWNEILVASDLRYFKMAEAMKWYGQFVSKYHDWGTDRDTKRDELINRLASVALRYELTVLGTFSDVGVLNNPSIPEKKEELFKATVLSNLSSVPDDHQVTLMCDEELDIEFKVRGWIRALRNKHGSKIAPVVGICYVDDRAFAPVQFADMAAWLFRDWGQRSSKTNGKDMTMHPLLVRLQQNKLWSLQQVETGKLLEDLNKFGEPLS